MATATLNDVNLTQAWVDITTLDAASASVDVLLQNVGTGQVAVVFGSDPSGGGVTGALLAPLDSIKGNAANVYARSIEANGKLSVTTL